jgi:hypothetical protein
MPLQAIRETDSAVVHLIFRSLVSLWCTARRDPQGPPMMPITTRNDSEH